LISSSVRRPVRCRSSPGVETNQGGARLPNAQENFGMAVMQLLTASRMVSLLSCPRKHFWRYECGLRSAANSAALRFGTAWHAAMEVRWRGGDYDACLNAAVATATGDEFDEVTLAKLAALIAGYFEFWASDPVTDLQPEIQFEYSMDGSRSFKLAGKIDGLGRLGIGGPEVLVEHKTTVESVEPESDYWIKLRADLQLMQYVLAARRHGRDPAIVFYDVTRKPSIAPKNIAPVDEAGCKYVMDAAGARVFKKDGTPRETGDTEKGYTVLTRLETAEEYGIRLRADIGARPDFYYARREVPVLEGDLREFETQRFELAKMILAFRQAERRTGIRQRAWPRNVGMTCRMGCEFAGFCLQNLEADENKVPLGFVVGVANPELEPVGAQ
jgi:hypothetical protein